MQTERESAPAARSGGADAQPVARLIYPTCHGMASAIVAYVREGNEVTFRLPELNPAVNYVNRTPVTVELLGTPGEPRWLSGWSRLVEDTMVSAEAAESLEQFPAGVAARYVSISTTPAEHRPGPTRRRKGGPPTAKDPATRSRRSARPPW